MRTLELIEAEDLVSRYYSGRSITDSDSHNDFIRWLYESGLYIGVVKDLKGIIDYASATETAISPEDLADIMGDQDGDVQIEELPEVDGIKEWKAGPIKGVAKFPQNTEDKNA